jgi:trimeric autotransporter adhesin
MNHRTVSVALLAAVLFASALPAGAQSDVLLRLRSGLPQGDRFRVDSAGGLVSLGQLGNGVIPASGGGVRMMWHPYKAAFRAGSADVAGNYWDEVRIGFFSWAGGIRTTASGQSALAFGDNVSVGSTAGIGLGSTIEVSGTAGFAAGFSNVCSGYACTALGHTVRAGGEGSVALGYRVNAHNNYTVALGYRASSGTRTGTFVWGDQSATDSVINQANNEFRIRAAGGVRLRTSSAANSVLGTNANTGCDLLAGTGTWSCSSSRTIKDDFAAVNGEDVLLRLRGTPVSTWRYLGEGREVRHLGPVAEDFHAAFGLGAASTSIGLGDIDGVNFAAAQALEARTASLRGELEAVRAELAEARRRLAEMEARLAKLEQR